MDHFPHFFILLSTQNVNVIFKHRAVLLCRSLCTYGRARICVLCISLAALIYNIPRFLEVTWVSHFDASLGQNRTEVRPTPLRQDPTYIR